MDKFFMKNSLKLKTCNNCGRKYDSAFCKYDNIERLVRLKNKEECPFWCPSPMQKIDRFKSEVFRKLKKTN